MQAVSRRQRQPGRKLEQPKLLQTEEKRHEKKQNVIILGLTLSLTLSFQLLFFLSSQRFVRSIEIMMPANSSLQTTRDGGSSSASRFTLVGSPCLSSGR